MADEKKVEQYVTTPGRKGIVRVLISPRPKAQTPAPLPGTLGPVGGYLPPSYLPDDDIPGQAQPFLSFYDLGTVLSPNGVPSYNERKGLLPVDDSLRYSDADWLGYQAQLLGSLASGQPEDGDPLGQQPVAVSGRKASNVWPFNLTGMGNVPPLLILSRKPGKPNPGDPTALKNWRKRDIEEQWSPLNTQHDLAPDWGRWKVPGFASYAHVWLSDARYMEFHTREVAQYKITREPNPVGETDTFKIGWPLKVYGVPRMYGATEGSSSSVFGFAEVRKRETLERGEIFAAGRMRATETFRLTIITVTIPAIGFGPLSFVNESSRHAMARAPLFPQPHTGAGPLSPTFFMAQQLSASALKVRRWLRLTIRRQDFVSVQFSIEGIGGQAAVLSENNNLSERTVDEVTFHERRTASAAQIEAYLRERVAWELAQDFGGPPPYTTSSFTYSGGTSAPALYLGPPSGSGQLRGIVVAGGKRYFVWKV